MSAAHMCEVELGVLFWYYKEPGICEQRLKELRRLNPSRRIFGLYGGDPAFLGSFASLLHQFDDHWVFDGPHDSHWKWRNGDQMLVEWFRRRGRHLFWESLVIVQWDVLMTAPLERIFVPLIKDDVYLPGLRRLEEVAPFWWWVRPNTSEGDAFASYAATVRLSRPQAEFWACQFLTAVLPRRFFDELAASTQRNIGFLEYTLPTFAKERGFRCIALPHLRVIWEREDVPHGRIVLTAGKSPIEPSAILAEMLTRNGARMFHPVTRRYGYGLPSIIFAALGELLSKLWTSLREMTRNFVRAAIRTAW